MTYPNAASGLQKVFWSEIVSIIASILSGLVIIGVLAYIASLVLIIWGLYEASRDANGYRSALYISVAGIAISLMKGIISSAEFLTALLNFVASILMFIALLIVINTTVQLLNSVGQSGIGNMGKTVITLNVVNIGAAALAFVVAILGVIGLSLGTVLVSGILAVLTLVISVVAGIMYMVFLYKSSKAL